MTDIRDSILRRRRRRIAELGFGFGHPVPDSRIVPIVPFLQNPPVICEVKRHSPSKGSISEIGDAATLAGAYAASGIKTVSVLTEEDFFHGSLLDLMRVKREFPHLCVLRKDFLFAPEDIDVSFRAGADAVLLIASMLESETLKSLYLRACDYGMAILVELHSKEDAEKVVSFAPEFVGINSRDLSSFKIDPIIPVLTGRHIDWPCRIVFESGIACGEHAYFAGEQGFSGILVGESVVRHQELIPELLRGFEEGRKRAAAGRIGFWQKLFRRKAAGRPLVKICGLTNGRDCAEAERLGADILGFVFAESPRRANPSFLRSLAKTDALKVGVVVNPHRDPLVLGELRALLEEGMLEAVQFHGDELPEECFALAHPYYKAVRIGSEQDCNRTADYLCPRVLVDAFSGQSYGGTGKRIDGTLASKIAGRGPLWLAGGISPENIAEIVHTLKPELIDVSSGVEESPGKKDHEKLKRLFEELDHA